MKLVTHCSLQVFDEMHWIQNFYFKKIQFIPPKYVDLEKALFI